MFFPRARCRARSKGRGCRRTRPAYDHKPRRRKAGVVVCAIWTEVITVRSWRPLQKILFLHHDVRSRARCAVAGQARRAGRRSDNCFGGHEMRAMHARIRRRPPHRKARAEPSACRRSPRRVVVRPSDSWRSLGLLCGRSPFFSVETPGRIRGSCLLAWGWMPWDEREMGRGRTSRSGEAGASRTPMIRCDAHAEPAHPRPSPETHAEREWRGG